jgi:hypothetical protein
MLPEEAIRIASEKKQRVCQKTFRKAAQNITDDVVRN